MARRKKKKKGSILFNLILIIAVIIFGVSAFQVYRIAKEYLDGRGEYEKIREIASDNDNEKEEKQKKCPIDFDKLMEINSDTVGWIRCRPEPSEIDYPIVQGENNQQYLHQTFGENDNTLGTIFLKVENSPDFSDRNSVIYGHRMRDGSMFRHIQDYDSKEFWEENPYFFIYRKDGLKLIYHVYSSGTVVDTTQTYQTEFASEQEFQDFIDMTKETALYDTGVEVTTADRIVTLSTCTSASDEHRFVVRGVLEKTVQLSLE